MMTRADAEYFRKIFLHLENLLREQRWGSRMGGFWRFPPWNFRAMPLDGPRIFGVGESFPCFLNRGWRHECVRLESIGCRWDWDAILIQLAKWYET